MHIAALGQHKAINRNHQQLPAAVEKYDDQKSSIFHPNRNILWRRSNAATETYRWTLGLPTLPTWRILLSEETGHSPSIICRLKSIYSPIKMPIYPYTKYDSNFCFSFERCGCNVIATSEMLETCDPCAEFKRKQAAENACKAREA